MGAMGTLRHLDAMAEALAGAGGGREVEVLACALCRIFIIFFTHFFFSLSRETFALAAGLRIFPSGFASALTPSSHTSPPRPPRRRHDCRGIGRSPTLCWIRFRPNPFFPHDPAAPSSTQARLQGNRSQRYALLDSRPPPPSLLMLPRPSRRRHDYRGIGRSQAPGLGPNEDDGMWAFGIRAQVRRRVQEQILFLLIRGHATFALGADSGAASPHLSPAPTQSKFCKSYSAFVQFP